jgi:hypothetical protein
MHLQDLDAFARKSMQLALARPAVLQEKLRKLLLLLNSEGQRAAEAAGAAAAAAAAAGGDAASAAARRRTGTPSAMYQDACWDMFTLQLLVRHVWPVICVSLLCSATARAVACPMLLLLL